MKNPLSNSNVLIVDDLSTNRLLAKTLLQTRNVNVVEAECGEDALKLIEGHRFDVVLLDIMMPGIDGFETCRAIREKLGEQLLPVIMLTALDGSEDVANAMAAGANDFVHKPFNGVELLARLGAAVTHKRVTDTLDSTESVLFALARMVEAKDSTTGGHCDRLAHMGVVFGERLGCSYEELEALRRGGVLHDIGKLGIPDSVLLKPGKLTEEEWVVMRRHPTIGASLVSPLRTMQMTADIVRCHHERWNGSGYPDGLKGEGIPYLARIFQLVDAYDALRSDRPYKKAFSIAETLKIMQDERERGLWDPALMCVLANILNECPEALLLPENKKLDKSAVIFDDIAQLRVTEAFNSGTGG